MSLLGPATSSPAFKWDVRTARHLLNRAGFGVPQTAITKLAAMKHAEAVSAFVDYEKFPDVGESPDWLPESINYRQLRQMATTLNEDEKRMVRREKQREARDAMSKLQIWWLDRMCHSQRPLEEKMTLFWHGHFATSAEKVKEPEYNYDLNQLFRKYATGNFRSLVLAVGKSGAMLRYLDQNQSSKEKPNENWARELMELFTLGIGNYTEEDIKQAARAFTGWTARDGDYQFVPRRHDTGVKTFMGRSGDFTGEQIVDIIFEQPACATFICTKLWKFFAYDEPEPEVIQGLAQTFRDSNFEIKPVMRQMFSSAAFFQEKAINTQVKSPAQLVVNLLVQLDAPISEKPPIAQLAMRAMGQSLFYPPNVKGWDGGRAWINTNTLLVRYNFANYLVSGVVPDFDSRAGGGKPAKKNDREMASDDMMSGGDDPMMQSGEGSRAAGNAKRGAVANGGVMDENSSTEGAREMPAGQDTGPSDIPSSTLYSALKTRREIALELRQMERAPFKARDFFAQYHGMTSEEIVDHLAAYFIGFPLERSQKFKLMETLAQGVRPGAPVPVTRMAEEDLRATVQLLLSTAEYQVC